MLRRASVFPARIRPIAIFPNFRKGFGGSREEPSWGGPSGTRLPASLGSFGADGRRPERPFPDFIGPSSRFRPVSARGVLMSRTNHPPPADRYPNLNASTLGSACDSAAAAADTGSPPGARLNTDWFEHGHSVFREEGSMWTVGSPLSGRFNTILNPNSFANCQNSTANIARVPVVLSASSKHAGGVVMITMADGFC